MTANTTTTKKQCIIFDIDGTVADISNRRHFVEASPVDWTSFFEESINDPVIGEVATVYKMLKSISPSYPGTSVGFLTARPIKYYALTARWLLHHNLKYDFLFMRPNDDRRPDFEIKLDAIKNKIIPNYGEPTMFFEDRQPVIDNCCRKFEKAFVFNVGGNGRD